MSDVRPYVCFIISAVACARLKNSAAQSASWCAIATRSKRARSGNVRSEGTADQVVRGNRARLSGQIAEETGREPCALYCICNICVCTVEQLAQKQWRLAYTNLIFLCNCFQIWWTALSVALGLEIRGDVIRGTPCVKRHNQLFCPTAGTNYPM